MAGHERVRKTPLAIALLCCAVASLTAAPAAGAQDGTGGVVRGGANASADSMSFQIVNAGASLGWTFGRSTAAYRDITATAEGKSVDLGALEALLGQPQCNGELPPALNLETLPPKTIADSNVAGSEVERSAEVIYPRFADDNSPDKVVGTQRSSADRTPRSQSSTETRNQDFGFFRIEGATSRASTSFEGGIRTASSEVSAQRVVVLGGQIIFQEPKWTAKAWSGAESGAEADFTFSSARVFGNLVSGSILERDLAIFETLIEGVLAPLGFDLRFPEVRRPLTGDGIEVTPLAIAMSDAPIARDLLIPLLGSDFLQNFRRENVSEDCRNETIWTVIDALERALGGSGSLDTLVGGAVATTDDTDYSFEPLPEATETTQAPATTTPTEPLATFEDPGSFDDSGLVDDFGSDFGSDFSDDFDTGSVDDLGVTDIEPVAEVGGIAEDADSSDDGEELAEGDEIAAGAGDGSGDGAALAVGIIALVGAIGLSLGDRFVGIRARRRIT